MHWADLRGMNRFSDVFNDGNVSRTKKTEKLISVFVSISIQSSVFII